MGWPKGRPSLHSRRYRSIEDLYIPEPNSGCWIWVHGTTVNGRYGWFYDPDGRRYIYGHRYFYELANGPITNGLHVCHRCDVGLCVNPDHLFLGTHADNMADMTQKGRRYMGGMPPRLTESQVLDILQSSETGAKIAERHGISKWYVSDIRCGRAKVWRSVYDRVTSAR